MSGWLRYLTLKAQVSAGLNAQIVIWAIIAVIAAVVTLTFLLVAAFVWLSDLYDGVIAGFCAVGPSIEEDWGEVYAIYLDPDRWGQGVGRALLAAGERALLDDGQWQALLWVLDRNVRAREFYERQGWVPGKPIRIENIGGADVNEARYEKVLGPP